MENKKRLIDADVVMDGIIDQLEIEWGYEGIREDVKRIFENAPTVDALEVVHGRWIKTRYFYGEEFSCSACGGWKHINKDEHDDIRYCPNCGSKMDGE